MPKVDRASYVSVWSKEKGVCTGCSVDAWTFPIYVGHAKRDPEHGEMEFFLCPRCLRLMAERTREALDQFGRDSQIEDMTVAEQTSELSATAWTCPVCGEESVNAFTIDPPEWDEKDRFYACSMACCFFHLEGR